MRRALAWPGDDVVRRGDPRVPQRARLLRAPRDGGAAARAVRALHDDAPPVSRARVVSP